MKSWVFTSIWLIVVQLSQAQDEVILQDARIGDADTVWIFKPKDYNADIAYPVVYMLHGYSGNYRQWHQIMDAQAYANAYDMIIICPDGLFNSWYIDSPKMKDSQYTTFFFETLMPEIEAKYAIDKHNRFITGLSMGGHGAFHLFLENPALFRSAGSTSGVMDLRNSAGKYQLHEYLGDFSQNKSLWLEMSIAGRIDELKQSDKELIFDCGTEDPFYQDNLALFHILQESKIPVTFISRPGKHDWAYWGASIKAHFEFFESKVE